MIKRLQSIKSFSMDFPLLLVRVAVAILMLTHGWPKLAGYKERLHTFSDPIGLGSEVSLTLVVFAEVFCSILIGIGLFTRFALIPLLISTLIIVFIVHANDPFGRQELGLLYFTFYVTLFFTGPGKFSADARLAKH